MVPTRPSKDRQIPNTFKNIQSNVHGSQRWYEFRAVAILARNKSQGLPSKLSYDIIFLNGDEKTDNYV